MKKIALLSIPLLLSFSAFSQFERVVSENSYVRFLRTLKGDYVMVFGSGDAAVFDEKGQTIITLDYDIPVGGYWNAFDLSDTSVVFTGGTFSFDQSGWFGIPFNRQFDVNWQEIATIGYLGEDAPNAEKMADGGFVFYDLNIGTIQRKSATGNTLWYFNDQNLEILDVTSNSNLQTIAATVQGLLILNSIGSSESLYVNYDFTHVESISFENIVGSKSDTIYLLDANYEVIQKAAIPGQVVKDMKSMEGKVAVLTESEHVYLFDQDLIPVSDFQLNDDHLTFKHIVPDQDGIVLAGDHQYGDYPNGNTAIFLKKYGIDGFDPFDKRDIGLYFIQPGQGTEFWQQDDMYMVRFHDMKFQVFNYSDTLLNSFQVNVRFPSLPPEPPFQPNSIEQHFYKQFNNLNLLPGQSATLTWEEFTAIFVDYPSGLNLELCFWSSLPDGKSDIDNSNDVACGDFLVDAKENSYAKQISFKVSPNPSTGECYVEFEAPFKLVAEIQIANLMGQNIQTHSLKDGNNRLKINDLPTGIYLVKGMIDNSFIGTNKLIVR